MFAEAALRCKEGDPLVASWAQSLWKPESRAFSHVKWMVVDSDNSFPAPSFPSLLPTHLHVGNKFFLPTMSFFYGNFQTNSDRKKEGGGPKPTFLQHFNQQPHFLLTVEVNFL